MKKIHCFLTLVLVGGFLLLNSCSKEDDSDNNSTATCSDGIQNQGETGVDCGGPCPDCLNSSMTATIDGNSWTANYITYMGISGHSFSGTSADNKRITITFDGDQAAVYSFVDNPYSNQGSYTIGTTVYNTGFNGTGSVTITSFENNVISGTFSFSAETQFGGNSVNITDGLFTDIELK